jgi:hypothetical protein
MILEPFTYRRVQVYPASGGRDYGVKWFANCAGISILAKTKAQMRQSIREELQRDIIMRSH